MSTDDEAGEAAGELVRRMANLDDELDQLGLYVSDKTVTAQRTDGGAAVVAVISGVVGKVAFSDRVQHPERWSTDRAFDSLVEHDILNEFDRRQRRLRDRPDDGRED